jgi:uncharacterized protein YqeY
MVSISERLDGELKEALKSRDELRLSVIRLIKASLKNKEIEKGGRLTEGDVLSVLSTLSKQRRESIDHFTSAGRLDLAEREKKELEIVHSYLPRQLSPQELDAVSLLSHRYGEGHEARHAKGKGSCQWRGCQSKSQRTPELSFISIDPHSESVGMPGVAHNEPYRLLQDRNHRWKRE